MGFHRECAHAPGEKRIARQGGQDLRSCSAERGVPADVAGKRRCDERGALVRPPFAGTNPIHAGPLQRGHPDVVRSFPAADFHFVQVLVFRSTEFHGVLRSDLFDVSLDDGQARSVVVRQLRVGALPAVGHPAQRRHRPHVVVPAFAAPRRNGGIVHGTAHREVGDDVPIEGGERLTEAAPFALQFRLVVDVVEEGEPVPGRRF